MAQQSNNALDAGSTSGSNAAYSDKQSFEDQSPGLIFINQYSKDHNRAKHGPSRRIIGSYVQRNIHRAKRTHATLRSTPKIWRDVQFRGRNHPSQLGADSTPQSLPQGQNTSADRNSGPIGFPTEFQVCGPPNQKDSSATEKIQPPNDQADNHVPPSKDISGPQLGMRNFQRKSTQLQSQANSPRTYLDTGIIGGLNHFEVFRISSPGSTKLFFHYCKVFVLQMVRRFGHRENLIVSLIFRFQLTSTFKVLETVVSKIFPVLSTAKEHRHWMFQATIANPELLFASSALSAAVALAAERKSDTDVPSLVGTECSKYAAATSEVLWFKAQAVRLLNTRIANSDSVQSDAVPYAIMCLLLAAIISGDQNEMITHATGLRRLIELRGTYVGLPMHVVAPVVSSFYISSAIGGIAPISPPQMVESDEVRTIFSTAFEAYPSLREIGCEFTHNEVTACLDWKIVKAFEEMREYVILREYFQRSQRIPTASQAVYFHNKCVNCHFLASRSPLANEIIATNRQEPCRLALLIFWNANTQLNGPESVLYRTLASQLKSALEITDLQTFWQKSFPVLMWIFLLGASVSSDRAERPWFLANMAEGMRLSGWTQWEWMRTILLRLLYLDNIYREVFERNWEEASALTVFPGAE